MERAVSAKLLRGVSVEAFLRYLQAGYVRRKEGAKNISYARTRKVCMVKAYSPVEGEWAYQKVVIFSVVIF